MSDNINMTRDEAAQWQRVEAALKKAILAEREACAQVAEAQRAWAAKDGDPCQGDYEYACEQISEKIRARSK